MKDYNIIKQEGKFAVTHLKVRVSDWMDKEQMKFYLGKHHKDIFQYMWNKLSF